MVLGIESTLINYGTSGVEHIWITSQWSGSPESKDSHPVYPPSWPLVPSLEPGRAREHNAGDLLGGPMRFVSRTWKSRHEIKYMYFGHAHASPDRPAAKQYRKRTSSLYPTSRFDAS